MNRGFSLGELMVVLALITVMLTLVMPLSMRWYRNQFLNMEVDRLAGAFKLGLKLATSNSRYYAIVIQYTSPSGPGKVGQLDITYRFQNCVVAVNGVIDCSNWPTAPVRERVQLTYMQMRSSSGATPPDWKVFFFTPMGEIKYCVIADCFAAGANMNTDLQYIPADLTLEFTHPLNAKRKGLIILSGGGFINAVVQ